MITVVNVVAASYSGSTWLNLMLGSHPEAFSVGEIDKTISTGRPVCTLHGDECPLWSRYDLESDVNPYIQIAQLSGKQTLIVNNTRRLLSAQKDPQIRSVFVWLIRDGRAVVASRLRKYKRESTWPVARDWNRATRKKERLIQRQPSRMKLVLHYEAVQCDPASTLRLICGLAALDFRPNMLQFWQHNDHFIGGNVSTLFTVARHHNIEQLHFREKDHSQVALDLNVPVLQVRPNCEVNLDTYRREDPANFVDERWKKELTAGQLRAFWLAAGRLNRRLGYS